MNYNQIHTTIEKALMQKSTKTESQTAFTVIFEELFPFHILSQCFRRATADSRIKNMKVTTVTNEATTAPLTV